MHPLIVSLKAARLRLGLTQVRLAELSGIAQPHIARIESGEPCTMRTYDRLLVALDKARRDHAATAELASQESDNESR